MLLGSSNGEGKDPIVPPLLVDFQNPAVPLAGFEREWGEVQGEGHVEIATADETRGPAQLEVGLHLDGLRLPEFIDAADRFAVLALESQAEVVRMVRLIPKGRR